MMNECTQDDARDNGTHFNLKFDFNLIEIEICFRNEIEMCATVYHDPFAFFRFVLTKLRK